MIQVPEPKNYGYAGMVVSLPQVVNNISSIINNERGKESGLDATIREVGTSMADLVTGLYQIGKLLRYEDDQRRIHLNDKNHTTYKDYGGLKAVVRERIEKLMNYAVVIGQDTLLLLENIWSYLHHLDKSEPDEFAFTVVKALYDAITE